MKFHILLAFLAAIAVSQTACIELDDDDEAPDNGGENGSGGGDDDEGDNGDNDGDDGGDDQITPIGDVSPLIPASPIPSPHDVIPEGNNTYYVARDGNDQNDGASPDTALATLGHARSLVGPGDVIVVRGGVYEKDDTIRLNSPSGAPGQKIRVFAYPGEEPIFDFTPQDIENNAHGFRLNADYWHLYGLTIRNAGHNGIRIDGSHNRIERLVSHNNYDTGIHMAGDASHNLIMNSDSFSNFNSGVYRPRIGNNADGFGAKFDIGPGNYFYGNRAFDNSDDGFDFWEAESRIVVRNSWAFDNGRPENFDYPDDFEGNGNGFKLGGNHLPGHHVAVGNTAFGNRGHQDNAKGFDHNNNTGALTLIHNTAFDNPRNFAFPNAPEEGEAHVFYNNLSVDGALELLPDHHEGKIAYGNSWQLEEDAGTGDFLSTDLSYARAPRQEDGSLADTPLFQLVDDSQLKEAGVNISLPFEGYAPDIGARGYQ